MQANPIMSPVSNYVNPGPTVRCFSPRSQPIQGYFRFLVQRDWTRGTDSTHMDRLSRCTEDGCATVETPERENLRRQLSIDGVIRNYVNLVCPRRSMMAVSARFADLLSPQTRSQSNASAATCRRSGTDLDRPPSTG
jgi:hypothetical protein